MILTPAELEADCALIVDRTSSYSPDLHMLLGAMYATGCREGEVLQRSRWTYVPPDLFTLQPQKGNPTRSVDLSLLPTRFVLWLTDPSWRDHMSSLMNLRRVVDQFSDYPTATCGSKQISTHRFRHNRIKQLALAGATVPEIKAYMGLTGTATVVGYRDSEIHV